MNEFASTVQWDGAEQVSSKIRIITKIEIDIEMNNNLDIEIIIRWLKMGVNEKVYHQLLHL